MANLSSPRNFQVLINEDDSLDFTMADSSKKPVESVLSLLNKISALEREVARLNNILASKSKIGSSGKSSKDEL